jgi:hypothetical protein
MITQKHYQYFNYINEENNNLPDNFRLYQNFPQTFYKVTRIAFDIPKKSDVRLIIYNVYGIPVKKLVDCELLPGNYEVQWKSLNNKPGVYYYKMFAGDFVDSKKVLLIGN